ncbi:flagellar assembly peptidoglycan hydrolase FlgJ [Marinomonas sp. 15G1-11]|uniref:Peptidoglycan hydrolase FlgJ n=1 Tax=Marinomonas phaeophyticola TaxID=3004091 RepID=A0ABT4JS97_9GAMM|nr:flagellar assembly peptidoglycan hydrolase FlgJ [Marinomonas sp. 15G1-11]MCZ2721198.1 flagellar assembly peptidoglycan hydrolase FlgJ [Marinomonas sp. 15G1-11]
MNKVNSNEFYGDFASLAALKTQAQKDPDAALKRVAQEFESIFIGMLLKNMRSSNEVIGGTDLFSSSQTRQYEEMLDSQMAQSMATSGGVGLADALIRQFEGRGTASLSAARAESSDDSSLLQSIATHDLAKIQLMAQAASKRLLDQSELTRQLSSNTAAEVGASNVNSSDVVPVKNVIFDSPESFVEDLWPLAQQAGRQLGVDPKAILAQAALETGWGKYPIAKADGSASFNMFGIKADSRWQGDRAVVTTLEYEDGVAKKQKAPFRSYNSFSESFNDYADFLQNSERYKDALQVGDNASMFAAYLQKGGMQLTLTTVKK